MKPYKRLFEKFSNVDDVLDRIIKEFEKIINGDKNYRKLLPNGKFSIYLFNDKPLNDNIKITTHFGNYKGSEFKSNYPKKWDIFISTKEFYEDFNMFGLKEAIDNIITIMAHEITHASQEINGFLNWQRMGYSIELFNKDRKIYGIHASKPTEQEAVLVELMINLKRNNIIKAYDIIYGYNSYFKNFGFKNLIKKLYSGNVNKKQILDLQKHAINKFKKDLEISDYEIKQNNIHDIALGGFVHLPVLKIILLPKEYQKYVNEFKKFIDDILIQYPQFKNNKKSIKDLEQELKTL